MDVLREFNAEQIAKAIDNQADVICANHVNTQRLVIAGVANGGVAYAKKLASILEKKMQREIPCGTLCTLFHRDDIGKNPIPKMANPTSIPVDIYDTVVIIVDDVISTGRSIRAAINELFSIGRPARVELAVLFDRGGRMLPIQPDYTGFNEGVEYTQLVKLFLTDAGELDSLKILNS